MFRRVTQNAAATMKAMRLIHTNHDPSWLLPCIVVRSSSDSALLNSTLCVPSSAAGKTPAQPLQTLMELTSKTQAGETMTQVEGACCCRPYLQRLNS
jgi:hypothetical protein